MNIIYIYTSLKQGIPGFQDLNAFNQPPTANVQIPLRPTGNPHMNMHGMMRRPLEQVTCFKVTCSHTALHLLYIKMFLKAIATRIKRLKEFQPKKKIEKKKKFQKNPYIFNLLVLNGNNLQKANYNTNVIATVLLILLENFVNISHKHFSPIYMQLCCIQKRQGATLSDYILRNIITNDVLSQAYCICLKV